MENNTVYIERKPSHFQTTIKKVGREPGLQDEKKAVRFMSYIKGLTLYKDGHDLIQFSNHEFLTDNEEDIKYIQTHAAFNNGIWKDKFPQHVIKKFEEDSKYITRDEDSFKPAEK